MGGLGNQMFQYALGRHLASLNNTTLKIDIFAYNTDQRKGELRDFELNQFHIQADVCSHQDIRQYTGHPILRKLNQLIHRFGINLFPNHVHEKQFHFDKSILELKNKVYLEGYWQSAKYLNSIDSIIRKDFTFKNDVLAVNKALKEKIDTTKSVAIHIRRGDYVNNPLHNVFDMGYIEKAVQLMLDTVGKDVAFFIFSDDLDWCKNNLFTQDKNITRYYCDGGSSIEDFQLMSSCKHFITANSTFSWWAAYLSHNTQKIVITPQKWFNNSEVNTDDIIPDNWIKL